MGSRSAAERQRLAGGTGVGRPMVGKLEMGLMARHGGPELATQVLATFLCAAGDFKP